MYEKQNADLHQLANEQLVQKQTMLQKVQRFQMLRARVQKYKEALVEKERLLNEGTAQARKMKEDIEKRFQKANDARAALANERVRFALAQKSLENDK